MNIMYECNSCLYFIFHKLCENCCSNAAIHHGASTNPQNINHYKPLIYSHASSLIP